MLIHLSFFWSRGRSHKRYSMMGVWLITSQMRRWRRPSVSSWLPSRGGATLKEALAALPVLKGSHRYSSDSHSKKIESSFWLGIQVGLKCCRSSGASIAMMIHFVNERSFDELFYSESSFSYYYSVVCVLNVIKSWLLILQLLEVWKRGSKLFSHCIDFIRFY